MLKPSFPKQAEWYEIRIKGHLDQRRIDMFENWKATHQPNGQTTLSGPVQDQAALYGILNRLRDLGIFIISLNCTSC